MNEQRFGQRLVNAFYKKYGLKIDRIPDPFETWLWSLSEKDFFNIIKEDQGNE